MMLAVGRFIWKGDRMKAFAGRALSAASIAELRAGIEGVYVLDEWQIDGKFFRPSRVEGRFVILNGVISLILVNKIEEAKQITVAGFGPYSLQANSFAYRYDSLSVFTETQKDIIASHALPWEGMRKFAAKDEGNTVHFQSPSAERAEFSFSPEVFIYSERGQVLRKWRRAKPE
jgi:hypothetical protein